MIKISFDFLGCGDQSADVKEVPESMKNNSYWRVF